MNATAFDVISDRNSKEAFVPVDAGTVLETIAALPITTWDFKADRLKRRHLGPMAQDFHAAFHLNGNDDTHINLGDLAGVGVAAIQSLQREAIDEDRQIARIEADQERQMADLQKALAKVAEQITQIERGQRAVFRSASRSLPR